MPINYIASSQYNAATGSLEFNIEFDDDVTAPSQRVWSLDWGKFNARLVGGYLCTGCGKLKEESKEKPTDIGELRLCEQCRNEIKAALAGEEITHESEDS